MLGLLFRLTSYSFSVDNIYLSGVSCANRVNGIHMFLFVQFSLRVLESGMCVGTFQRACWDWASLRIRVGNQAELKAPYVKKAFLRPLAGFWLN